MRGRDIKRNGYEFAGLYLIATHNGYIKEDGVVVSRIEIEDYPAVKRWLESETWNDKPDKGTAIERLSNRTDKGKTPYNLRDCVYMDDFNRQKICYSETNDAIETKIYLDNQQYVTDKTCFILISKNDNLIGQIYKILSSPIFTWYMQRKSPRLGHSGISLTKDSVELFPLAIDDDRTVQEIYHLTNEEIKYISSSVRL